MKDIFVIGGLSYDSIVRTDRLPEPREQTLFSKKYFEGIGGTGAVKSLNLSKLGFNVTFHEQIGDDNYGLIIKKFFYDNKINFIPHFDKAGTERHINIVDDNGDRVSIYVVYSTFNPNIDLQIIENEIKKTDIVALNIINYCRRAIPMAKKYKKTIWCDIHDFDGKNEYHKDFIDGADAIFMCSTGMKNWKEFMLTMIDNGKKFVVCTHGKDGVTALTDKKEWINLSVIKEYSEKFVDSNGAGDSFFSGFLYGYNKGLDITDCLKYGNINGGLCITGEEFANKNLSPDYIESEYKKYYEKKN